MSYYKPIPHEDYEPLHNCGDEAIPVEPRNQRKEPKNEKETKLKNGSAVASSARLATQST